MASLLDGNVRLNHGHSLPNSAAVSPQQQTSTGKHRPARIGQQESASKYGRTLRSELQLR